MEKIYRLEGHGEFKLVKTSCDTCLECDLCNVDCAKLKFDNDDCSIVMTCTNHVNKPNDADVVFKKVNNEENK